MRYATDAELSSSSLVGGKAFNLARLSGFGAVPEFLVLIGGREQHDVPPDLLLRLKAIASDALFAVRSSATAEDSEGASFPGLFDTRLGVTLDRVPAAVAEVASSVSSPRVTEYLEARGLGDIEIEMSVVIQRMVDSEVAGVCLSRFSHGDERTVIEAVWGLGEQLVGGGVAPDRYAVDMASGTIEVQVTAYQASQLRLGASGPADVNVATFDRNAQKLESEQILTVATTARRIHEAFSWGSADVEFAFDAAGLHLLQARPFAGYDPQAT